MAINLNVDTNEEGKAIVRLYGVDIDLTDKADKNGRGSFHYAGDDYSFRIKKEATKKSYDKVSIGNKKGDTKQELPPKNAEEGADEV